MKIDFFPSFKNIIIVNRIQRQGGIKKMITKIIKCIKYMLNVLNLPGYVRVRVVPDRMLGS
jgi:hypothetical protein